MTKEELKQKVISEIDKSRDRIIKIGEDILNSPELGYKEIKTSEYIAGEFDKLGLEYRRGLAITGVKAKMRTSASKCSVCVMGEMDGVACQSHPKADKNTSASHACGHNAQIAAMLGAAIGLNAVREELCGDIYFFAVPAEEFVEMGYRESLIQEGKIKFLGGKQELIRLGEFDDIDMAMMVHAQGSTPKSAAFIDGSSLGFVAKTVTFKGKAAHAGGAPYEGINALNAAMAAMMCIHAQRETFRDEDKIRVHPIITNGGELVNIVPANVTMETYVRGANYEGIADADAKVDRAINGAAYAIGATAQIKNFKGYLPLFQDKKLSELFANNCRKFISEENIYYGIDMVGSSDVGDLSHLIPTIQPTMGGFVGSAHSSEFAVSDFDAAYLEPAKAMAMTVVDLLSDGAKVGLEIKENFKPKMTKEEYLNK